MRTVLWAALVAVTLTACGGDDGTGPAPSGDVIFRVDPVTCTGQGTVELFIDGNSKGQYTMAPGSTQTFEVDAGPHALGAREIGGGGFVWPTENATVPANSSYTALLVCTG